jgi:DNA-binding transcriptional LysR family regulator
VPFSPIVEHLPNDLANFLALNPAIRVSIGEGVSRNVVQAVSENLADIGVFGGGMTTGSLHVTSYRAGRLVVIMPSVHPLAGAETVRFAEMAEYDIVGPQQGSCLDHLMIRAALGRSLQVRIRVDGFEPSSSMVEAGLGIARCPNTTPCVASHTDSWSSPRWMSPGRYVSGRSARAIPRRCRSRSGYCSTT